MESNNDEDSFYVHDASGIYCNIDAKENKLYTVEGFNNKDLIANFAKLPDAYEFTIYHNDYSYHFLLKLNPISEKIEKINDDPDNECGEDDEYDIVELKIDCMDPTLILMPNYKFSHLQKINKFII